MVAERNDLHKVAAVLGSFLYHDHAQNQPPSPARHLWNQLPSPARDLYQEMDGVFGHLNNHQRTSLGHLRTSLERGTRYSSAELRHIQLS